MKEVFLNMATISCSQLVSIGGVKVHITPFAVMADAERGNPSAGIPPLTKYQFSSMLLHNLGYNLVADDPSWLDVIYPAEEVAKTSPFDYPVTENVLWLRQDKDTLWNVLECIRNWGRNTVEQGIMLNIGDSFNLPDAATVQYNIENGIAVKRTAALELTPMAWVTNDIFSRRKHELCPQVNEEYFHNCIRNFEEYSKQIIVSKPFVMFTAAMINPDIVMSMIKNAEMEAAKIVNKMVAGYAALRPDFETAKEFYAILTNKNNHLVNVFYKRGAKGFVAMSLNKRYNSQDLEASMTLNNDTSLFTTAVTEWDEVGGADSDKYFFEVMSAEQREEVVDSLDSESLIKEISAASRYIDLDSIPNYIKEEHKTTDSKGNVVVEYGYKYEAILKRICFIYRKIDRYYGAMLDPKVKLIFSKPFFVNKNSFALYSRKDRLFILMTPEITFQILTPGDAIRYYKERHGENVELDPDEIGEYILKEPTPTPDISFEGQVQQDAGYALPPHIVPMNE